MEQPSGLGVLEDARFVMEHARHVAIVPEALDRLVMALRDRPVPTWNAEWHFTDFGPRTANYLLLLDALNFSFWGEPRWGIVYRGQTLTGYFALAAALKRAIEEGFALDTAPVMAELSSEQLRHVLRGTGEIPLFEARLAHAREVGARLIESYEGQFAHAITQASSSAVRLVEQVLRDFPSFQDTAMYAGRRVRILKRAQILAADLYGAFGGRGLGEFHDLGALTAFADYKVPQILEGLGLLRYAPELDRRIVSGECLEAGSSEEVEIRAGTIWGVECLRRALEGAGRTLSAVELDWILWEAAEALGPAEKPFHLTRTTAY